MFCFGPNTCESWGDAVLRTIMISWYLSITLVFHVFFKKHLVGEFVSDIVVDNKVLIEIKAVNQLGKIHEAQLINYLKATDIEIGLLLNFGKDPQFVRKIFENEYKWL